MVDADAPTFSEGEEYANLYFYFVQALKVLAEDAASQCKIMGYFNVAWEIRDDVTRGAQEVRDHPDGNLSDEEKMAINQLLADLANIPDSVFRKADSEKQHMRAMSDPSWIPARRRAKDLILALAFETSRTNKILGT